MKQFAERGLDKRGITLIATGDVTDDDQLNDMGDVALGVVNSHHYSAAHPSADEQEVRRGVPGREQGHAAELHGGRRLRRHARDLQGARGDQGRGRREAARRDEGPDLREPARPGADRRARRATSSRTSTSARSSACRRVGNVEFVYNVEFRTRAIKAGRRRSPRQARSCSRRRSPIRGGLATLRHADPPLRRHRLRHAAVRARRRARGDARADELHQPRARRVRDGGRLHHGAADEPRRRAVPRLPAARLPRRRALLGAVLEPTLYRRMYAPAAPRPGAVLDRPRLHGGDRRSTTSSARRSRTSSCPPGCRAASTSAGSASARYRLFIIVVCALLALALQCGAGAHPLRQPAARRGRRPARRRRPRHRRQPHLPR